MPIPSRAIACIIDAPPDHVLKRLDQMGVIFRTSPVLDTARR